MGFRDSLQVNWGHGTALAIVAACLYVARKRRRSHWPMAPGKLPLVGHAVTLSDPEIFYPILKGWIDGVGKEEGIFEFYLLGQRWIVLCSTESVMALSKLRPFKIRRAKIMSDAIDSLQIKGLFTSEGDRWRKERRIVAPALNKQHVRDFHPSVQLVSRRVVQRWNNFMNNNKSVPAANDDITAASLDIVALTILGMDLNTLEHPETQLAKDMQELFVTIFTRLLAPFPYWKIPIIGSNLDGFREGNQRLVNVLTKLAKDYRDRKEEGETSESKNFLEKIIDISEGEKAKFSDEEVVGNLMTIFAAATDTTSNSISFALWELANDLELQEELYEEVSNFMKDGTRSPDDLTMEDCEEHFHRLRSFLYEIVRIKGPTPLNYFEAVEPMEFMGKTIYPGEILTVVYASSPLDPNRKSDVPLGPNGESPQEFCALRWLSTESEAEEKKDDDSKPQPKFRSGSKDAMPFGNTVRICPGRLYANVEMTTILVHLLHNFHFTLAKDCPPLKMVSRFTLTLDKELKLTLTPRNV